MTGENAKTSDEAVPETKPATSSKHAAPAKRASGPPDAAPDAALSRPEEAPRARMRSMSAAVRETSIAMIPVASAPQNADIVAIAQAGFGRPRNVTHESRRANTHAHIVQEGYPGGWGTPA